MKYLINCYVLGATGEINSSASSSSVGNVQQKKSILFGKRPGLGVSSMINQYKSLSQPKKSPNLSQRPSAFCSSEGEDEDEDADYARFLEIKGNSRFYFSTLYGDPPSHRYPCDSSQYWCCPTGLWQKVWWCHKTKGSDGLLKVSPPEDSDTRLIIDKMASFVAEGGPELERKAKEDYKDDPVFSLVNWSILYNFSNQTNTCNNLLFLLVKIFVWQGQQGLHVF